MSETCVVFVCNVQYFDKFISTLNQLYTNGNYKGDVCLVIGDDLLNNELLNNSVIVDNNIIIKYFPNLIFPEEFLKIAYEMKRSEHWFKKIFQYHKLHLFNVFFKQWKFIFYIDCGMIIYSDINPMLNERKSNTLLAHSDAYPTYVRKLSCQFDANITEYYDKLNNKYNMNVDYCQTTIMLYDTNIIEDDTFDNLFNLTLEYPISITNDQGVIALYFTNIKPLWQQIPIKNDNTYFYDYYKRDNSDTYIMVKIIL